MVRWEGEMETEEPVDRGYLKWVTLPQVGKLGRHSIKQ